ncbi:MAG TPA: CarD family transcriptional regulator [bacterium]|nr:CarD family transcriptional regulator [bacterium]
MYKVGDKILHPLHGVGIIESVTNQEVLGVIQKYYVVDLTLKNMRIMIPVDSAEEVGVRKIIKSEVIKDVLDALKSKKVTEVPSNWNRRYRHNFDKIKTGDVFEVADVLRNLHIKEQKKGLSMGEKKILDNAMSLLVGEIVCAKKVSVDKARTYIMDALH